MGVHYGIKKIGQNIKALLADLGGGSTIKNVYAELQDDNYAQISGDPLTIISVTANKIFNAQIATGATAGGRSILWAWVFTDIPADASNVGTVSGGASSISDTGASFGTSNEHDNGMVVLTGGTGEGQKRIVGSHTNNQLNTTKPWVTQPDGTTTYDVYLPANVNVDRDNFYVSANLIDDIDVGLGTGSQSIIFHIKDSVPNNIADVQVTIFSADNTTKVAGPSTTNADGNTGSFNLNAGTYSLRMNKAGAVNSTQSKTVTLDATIEVVVTVDTITPPADPELCRLYVFPITLDNQDVASLVISISTKGRLTKVNGEFIEGGASGTFALDSSTTPDSYYFDAVQGAVVNINCVDLGIIDRSIEVPAEDTKDLNLLIS